ncbi:hypothetical protein [uncultured Corynebacterium sp.]|uniref:hypothetical protein n=1 Tax=uncultured Corynebacterium sp. TaxID=159447 RepID=UPI00259A7283|nr:hypothetical protein [uncultured Corynebacterium sp.]
MNQQPRQGGSWQPHGNSGQNAGWGSAQPNSGWGGSRQSPGSGTATPGNNAQWGGQAGVNAGVPHAAAPQGGPATAEHAATNSAPEAAAKDKKKTRKAEPKKAPLASWPNFAQIALALVIAALALFVFSYLQDLVTDFNRFSSLLVYIQFGLYLGLGLVFVFIRWLSSDTRPFLWASMLAVVWLSVFFLRMDNRPWMLGILVLLAGIVFPIALMFMGIIADARGERLGTAGAYFLSLLFPIAVFGLFAFFYHLATGGQSGGQEIRVPWVAPWYLTPNLHLAFMQILGKFPIGQFLAFIFVVSCYLPIASRRSASND